MPMKKILLLVLVALTSVAAIAFAATADTNAVVPAQAIASLQDAKPTLSEAKLEPIQPATPDSKKAKSGKVVEVIDSPMYTYLKVTSDTGTLWLAAYKTDITKGATVKYSNGVAMHKFYSKALNRTFDMIVFVDSLELVMN